MMHGRMPCGSPIELAQKTSKKRMIDAAIAQTYCSRICIRSSGVEAHGRIQRGGTATADQVTDSGFSIRERVDYALQLVDDCRSQEFVKDESSKEFLSYWGRGAASGSKTLSLIDLSVSTPRRISVVQADEYSLVAESLEVIDKWLQNQGKTAGAGSKQAIFACIDSPPGLPLPRNTRQFLRQIVDQCREINPLISQLSPSEPTHFFFAVRAPEGLGVIGAKISPAPQNGFRKPKRNGREQYLSARRLRAIWSCFGKLTLLRVERVDGAWVHGRGQDDRHQILANKRVVRVGNDYFIKQPDGRLLVRIRSCGFSPLESLQV